MKILSYSFGYDMTINEYFLVLSENGKTAMVQSIGRKVTDDNGMGGGRSIPDPDKKGRIFRVKVKDDYYRGRFSGYGTHTDTAFVWNGQPEYYNTWD